MIPAVIDYLARGGHQAPSADNSQPWVFTWDGATLRLHYDGGKEVDAVFGEDSHCERFTMGAVVENIVSLAEALGLQGSWDLVPDGTRYLGFRPSRIDMQIPEQKQHAVFERHTNRFTFVRRPLESRLAADVAGMTVGDCRLRYFDDASHVRTLGGVVGKASSLRFRNRTLHEWFGRTLRFSPEEAAQGTGLDVATIELPPGGGAFLNAILDWRTMSALNHLHFHKLMALIEAKAIRRSPGMLAVLGPEGAAFDAGRLMERAWLRLNESGVGVQPYYVVTDQLIRLERGSLPQALVRDALPLSRSVMEMFGRGNFVHMLLRVGYPKSDPVRSRRLPLHDRLRDLTDGAA